MEFSKNRYESILLSKPTKSKPRLLVNFIELQARYSTSSVSRISQIRVE